MMDFVQNIFLDFETNQNVCNILMIKKISN